MIGSTRRQRIEAMLADEPGDAFLRYSLAMELEKEGDHEASLAQLRTLLADTPPYVPAYFRGGQQLAALGRLAEARGWLRDGIEQARACGDAHAAGEMSELLASLGALGE
jgi:tetratricopeptide (TPR) repeat protein